jgi:prepilin-type N-terminal cleavage/methylation domain-containing protein
MNRHAFTLLELIVVVGILALLFSALFLLLKPAEKFAEGRNVKRRLDIEAIANAIVLHREDGGTFPAGIDDQARLIVTDATSSCAGTSCSTAGSIAGCINITNDLRHELTTIPKDPKATDGRTLYYVRYKDRQLEVGACSPEPEGKDSLLPSLVTYR